MKIDDGNLGAGRTSLAPRPDPRQPMSSGKKIALVAGLLAALMIGAGVVGSMMFSRLRDLGGGCPPAPLADVAPKVTETRPAPGSKLLALDWTLPPDLRPQCYSPVDVLVTVTLPSGEKAAGADVIALWGTDFVERARTDESGVAKVLSWPGRAGTLHVYARIEAVGAAAIPCVVDPHFSHGSKGDKAGFRCQGKLEAGTRLDLPAPPVCPADGLKPVFDLIAPGACFGLTALELSRLPYPATHVSTTRYEAFHPFQVPLEKGAIATELSLKRSGPEAAQVYSGLLAALTKALGEPKTSELPDAGCGPGNDWAVRSYEATGVGSARLSGRLKDCDPSKVLELRLELRQLPE